MGIAPAASASAGGNAALTNPLHLAQLGHFTQLSEAFAQQQQRALAASRAAAAAAAAQGLDEYQLQQFRNLGPLFHPQMLGKGSFQYGAN